MSVSGPVEPYDLKELLGFTAYDLLRHAAECVAVEVVYQTVMKNGAGKLQFNNRLYEVCWEYSLVFSRILLHPHFSNDKLVKDASLNCGPAYFGPNEIRGPITGQLILLAKMVLQNRTFQSGQHKLFFFEDSGHKMGLLSLKTAVYWICTSRSRSTRLHISTHEKASLMSAYLAGVRANDPVLSIRLIIRAMDNLYQNATKRTRDTTYYPSSWPPFRFIYKVEAEAVRKLRDGEMITQNLPESKPYLMTTTPHNGKVTWSSTDIEGSLPLCEETDIISYSSTGLSYLIRPIGRFASVLSDWYSYIMFNPDLRAIARIQTVGVGLGAVAAAFLDLTTSQICGHEIPAYFPLISQRDLSYIPLEVRVRDSTRFSWHPDSFRRPFVAGSVYDHCPDEETLIVFDIDCLDLDVLRSIARSKIRFCARVRTCERNLRSFLSVCPAKTVRASADCGDHSQLWFVKGKSMGIPMEASNYQRVSIESVRKWIPAYKSCVEASHQRFLDIVSRFGYDEPVFSFDRAEEIATEIRSTLVPERAQKIQQQTLDRLDGYRLLRNALLSNSVLELIKEPNREARRTALTHLAATQPSLARSLLL